MTDLKTKISIKDKPEMVKNLIKVQKRAQIESLLRVQIGVEIEVFLKYLRYFKIKELELILLVFKRHKSVFYAFNVGCHVALLPKDRKRFELNNYPLSPNPSDWEQLMSKRQNYADNFPKVKVFSHINLKNVYDGPGRGVNIDKVFVDEASAIGLRTIEDIENRRIERQRDILYSVTKEGSIGSDGILNFIKSGPDRAKFDINFDEMIKAFWKQADPFNINPEVEKLTKLYQKLFKVNLTPEKVYGFKPEQPILSIEHDAQKINRVLRFVFGVSGQGEEKGKVVDVSIKEHAKAIDGMRAQQHEEEKKTKGACGVSIAEMESHFGALSEDEIIKLRNSIQEKDWIKNAIIVKLMRCGFNLQVAIELCGMVEDACFKGPFKLDQLVPMLWDVCISFDSNKESDDKAINVEKPLFPEHDKGVDDSTKKLKLAQRIINSCINFCTAIQDPKVPGIESTKMPKDTRDLIEQIELTWGPITDDEKNHLVKARGKYTERGMETYTIIWRMLVIGFSIKSACELWRHVEHLTINSVYELDTSIELFWAVGTKFEVYRGDDVEKDFPRFDFDYPKHYKPKYK